MPTRSLKFFCDFCTPSFQYHSPRENELLLGYGSNEDPREVGGDGFDSVGSEGSYKSFRVVHSSGSCVRGSVEKYFRHRPKIFLGVSKNFNKRRDAGAGLRAARRGGCQSV